MVFIYILKLTDDKYYVGKTDNPGFRINAHFNKTGSVWTTKYKVLELVELIPNCDQYDEDKYTIKYMQLYGINNVRGGSFCQLELDQNDSDTINKMFIGASDKCYNCQESGHFVKDCKEVKIINDYFTVKKEKLVVKNKCTRCKRFGHLRVDCYANTSLKGNKLKKRFNF